jgi:Domain of unknown function (DUF305)
MNDRAKVAALGASGLAGVLAAALVAAIQLAMHSGNAMGAGREFVAHEHGSAAPLCRPASQPAEPDFYSEISEVNARMHQAMEVAPSDDIDRDFIRMMIPHHQGAIDMARVLLKYGRDERLKRLAQSIIVEQGQEITYMRSLEPASPAEAPAADPR